MTDGTDKRGAQILRLHALATLTVTTMSKFQTSTGKNVLSTATPGVQNTSSPCELHIIKMFRANGSVLILI